MKNTITKTMGEGEAFATVKIEIEVTKLCRAVLDDLAGGMHITSEKLASSIVEGRMKDACIGYLLKIAGTPQK